MADTTMPAAEAAPAVATDDERNSYELAFHVLPTVAEGEVAGVFEEIKASVVNAGGEIFDEEASERIELAYDIVQHIEGKNRAFHSAYFGWVRFKAPADAVDVVTEALESRTDILRHLLIKLTKVEEEHPFRYHEAQKSKQKITDVVEEEVILSGKTETEEKAAVSDEELDESIEKITSDDDTDGSEKTTEEDNESKK